MFTLFAFFLTRLMMLQINSRVISKGMNGAMVRKKLLSAVMSVICNKTKEVFL
jgi:hypothetical protein